MKCCLCNKEIEVNFLSGWADGNNAMPLKDGRCCDLCNMDVVAERIRLILEARKND